MSFRLLILVTIATISFSSIRGQSYVDILTLDYVHYGITRFEDEGQGKSTDEIAIDLTVPVRLDKGHVGLAGMVYEQTWVAFREEGKRSVLGFLLFRVGGIHPLNEYNSLQWIAIPKFSAPFGSIHKDAFQYGGLLQWNRQSNRNISWKWAIYANNEFFGTFVTPFIGFYARKGNWQYDIYMPARGDIGCYVSEDLRLGILFRSKFGSMLTDDDAFSQTYVSRVTNDIGLYAEQRYGGFVLFITAGRTLGRYVRVYDRSDGIDFALNLIRWGDDRIQLNPEWNDAFFVKSGIRYRFDIDQK